MNRSRLASVLVAVLAGLALAVGAAVIDARTGHPRESGGGTGSGSRGFFGSGSSFSLGSSSSPPTIGTFPAEFLQVLLVVVGALALVFFVFHWKELSLADLRRAAVGAVVLGALLAAGYCFLRLFGGGSEEGNASGLGASQPSLPGGGAGGSSDAALQPLTTGLPVVALVVGVVLVVGLAVVTRSGSDAEMTEPESASADPAVMAGVGRAAGRAADRIADDAKLENEVYRAWREMTRHLDVARPESSTPGEFARAATEAGMNEEDIEGTHRPVHAGSIRRRGGHGRPRTTRDEGARTHIEETYTEEP